MNIIVDYEWSTHLPLIRTVMELYKPKFVLELGTGINSTPVFLEYKTKIVRIENDPAWMKYIGEKFKTEIMFHDLNGLKMCDHLDSLNQEQRSDISSYYSALSIPDIKPSLLFVDQYTSCRTLSINTLGGKFDLIIYHDCQPAGIQWYNYDLIDLKGYTSYFLKTVTSWTALMVKDNIDFEALSDAIKQHIDDYVKKYPEVVFMELSKEY